MRIWLLAVLVLGPAAAAEDFEFFETKVRPVFAAKCASCHGAKTRTAGLDLTTGEGFQKGPDTGTLIDPSDVSKSRLLRALSYQDRVKMPPSGRLEASEIAAIEQWVQSGAKWPRSDSPAVPERAGKKAGFAPGLRRHWSLQPVKALSPPEAADPAWNAHPVDKFLFAAMAKAGLKPAPEAPKLTLLRRVTFDLTGLPPTPQESSDFLADTRPDAWNRLVERLLSSPQYGEKWGRNWLDVARYADSTGMDEDHLYPNAWRYRDYVIGAFNRDLRFDRFLTEQLAGDVLGSGNDAIVATGFLALGPKPLAQQDRQKMIYDVVDEQIDTTSRAFLGLSIACARCHDHKFDPILTKDYYALAGIFASTRNFRSLGRASSVAYVHNTPLVDAAEWRAFDTQRRKAWEKRIEFEEALARQKVARDDAAQDGVKKYLSAVWRVSRGGQSLAAEASRGSLDRAMLARWVAYFELKDKPRAYLDLWRNATAATIGYAACEMADRYWQEASGWNARLERWRKQFLPDIDKGYDAPPRPEPPKAGDSFFADVHFGDGPLALREQDELPQVASLRAQWKALEAATPPEPPMAEAVVEGDAVEQKIFVRGNHLAPGEPAPKAFPVVLAGQQQTPISAGSGRTELARWLTRPDHPLTSRVIVNRIWQWHFGDGLVRTPSNFGLTGERPTHPELLDFLAARFVSNGWSIKEMHRFLLSTRAYRMSSVVTPEAREKDPQNRLLSHFSRRRLSVEEIRDGMLAIDGTLDRTLGGSLLEKKAEFDPEKSLRRTVYFPVRRGSLLKLLDLFDFGDGTTSNEGRSRTNVAPQALFMMNSGFVLKRAENLAAGLGSADPVNTLYQRVLGRHATASEKDQALSYVRAVSGRSEEGGAQAAWRSLCHILLVSNEAVYVD